jgi:hypothetical protein
MKINVYSGIIQTLGASTTTNGTVTTYSYIEMSDGQMIKNLRIRTGLNGELQLAFNKGETVELSVDSDKDLAVVFAIRLENGRAFSDTTISIPWVMYFFTVIFGFLAFVGLAQMLGGKHSDDFGWGLFFFISGILLTRFLLKGIRYAKQRIKYLETLNPIYIN